MIPRCFRSQGIALLNWSMQQHSKRYIKKQASFREASFCSVKQLMQRLVAGQSAQPYIGHQYQALKAQEIPQRTEQKERKLEDGEQCSVF